MCISFDGAIKLSNGLLKLLYLLTRLKLERMQCWNVHIRHMLWAAGDKPEQ